MRFAGQCDKLISWLVQPSSQIARHKKRKYRECIHSVPRCTLARMDALPSRGILLQRCLLAGHFYLVFGQVAEDVVWFCVNIIT